MRPQSVREQFQHRTSGEAEQLCIRLFTPMLIAYLAHTTVCNIPGVWYRSIWPNYTKHMLVLMHSTIIKTYQYIDFFRDTSTLYLLKKPGHFFFRDQLVRGVILSGPLNKPCNGHKRPPLPPLFPCMPSFLGRIGFSIPTASIFFLSRALALSATEQYPQKRLVQI